MKRWQVRGEVLDSEEEDSSITAESQSEDLPRKRVKTQHEGTGEPSEPQSDGKGSVGTSGSQEDDIENAAATIEEGPDVAEAEVVGGNAGPDASESMTNLPAETALEEPAWTTQRPITTYSRRRKLPRLSTTRARELVPVITQAESDAVQLEELSTFVAASSSVAPSEAFLPSPSGLNSPEELAEPSLTPPTSEQQPVAGFRSGASSPLSELSDPPDSPPLFLDLSRSVRQLDDVQENADRTIPVGPEQSQVFDLLSTQGPMRRSLRARQEKQLHPYMHDKALYQRQCRERGMRPITLAEQRANETQEASMSHDETQPHSETQPREATALHGDVGSSQGQKSSDDELPDFHALIFHKTSKSAHGRKRQKLKHVTSRPDITREADAEVDGNEFMVPPSPPSSSMGVGTAKVFQRPTSGFRLPRGLSPKALPTPQISSEVRPSHRLQVPISSAESSPPRTLRRTPMSRLPATIISDDSCSGLESAPPEVEDHRLVKERRRIRGVLPASWLKIDLKAQQSRIAPAAYESDDDLPPRATAPARGVAQKVTSRRAVSSGRVVLDISDDDQSDQSTQAKVSASNVHAPTESLPHQSTAHLAGQIDENDMEVDWIDSMLAGSRRERNLAGSRQKNRSRNTSARVQGRVNTQDLTEERIGLREMHGRETRRRNRASGRVGPAKKKTRTKPDTLSILDAQVSPVQFSGKLPQFVRLAARQARRATDSGRHSPSRKIIRLATRDDTEEANAVLTNWRCGRIKQSERPRADPGLELRPSEQSTPAVVREQRKPLLEITNGQAGSRVSGSARKPVSHRGEGAPHPRTTQQSRRTPLGPATLRILQNTNPRDEHDNSAATRAQQQRTRQRAAQRVVKYRGAQLESLEDPLDQQNRSLAFERRIQCLTESVARRGVTPVDINLPMTRFLQSNSRTTNDEIVNTHINQPDAITAQPVQAPIPRPAVLTRRPRKRQPRRLDVDAREYRQPIEPLPDPDTRFDEPELVTVVDDRPVLQGLGQVGTRYAVDFDIRPLPEGTYFHESTFIGSGDFATSLTFGKRDLDTGYGTLTIHINGTVHSWYAWTEEVGSAMAEIPSATTILLQTLVGLQDPELSEQRTAVTANVDHMLRSVVRYTSICLHFHDPVDRSAYIQKLVQLAEDVTEVANDLSSSTDMSDHLRQRILQYALVFTQQARTISDTAFVPPDIRFKCEAAFKASALRLASCLMPTKLANVRDAYERCRTGAGRDQGIREDHSAIAGILILYHITKAAEVSQSSFWSIVSTYLGQNVADTTKVSYIDSAWYAIYSLLPAMAFDASGFVGAHGRESTSEVDWTLPKRLVERTLTLYNPSSAVRGSNVNEYVRATLRRCYHLVTIWRWWRCESILGPIYDFFAHLSLGLLHKEEGKGSPDFLAHLDIGDALDLQLQPGDCSFHIFLKLLASTLRGLRHHNIYPDKKIGGIAWRFIPNHARVYRKDAELKQTDLDALRNHCDLLSVLYFASPPTSRLGTNLLRDLVDHSSSHREACRISVRAWANMASFQTSTAEPTSSLEPFAQWYRDMVQTTVIQYRLARTEAEQHYAEARAQGISDTTEDVVERTVASNQKQIAATLVDLLAAIKRAAITASSISVVKFFIETCEPWKIFDTFSPSERRLLSVFREALDLTKALFDLQQQARPIGESQIHSEDSQDYGDISIFQEFDETGHEPVSTSDATDVVTLMVEPLTHLMSNAFGSELPPDDAFLTQMIDVWVRSAAYLVSRGSKTWHNFVDDYSPGAWYQLRDTEQHAKFTPYLLGRIVETDVDATHQLKQPILLMWLKSMVERESKLKFQHVLTTALLNAYDDEPLLSNLPLVRSLTHGRYQVSLSDFRQRRVAILSSVLSNMQDTHSNSVYGGTQAITESRRAYSEMLRQLMHAMKSNYQDLQVAYSSAPARVDAQGAYVEFIQQIVSCLQQYSTDICPIDRFFTDSSAFPLPATDPAYVVGRLKSYAPKLYEAKTRKQLAVFVHTVAERAAVDGQQTYLVGQFFAAMAGTMVTGNSGSPSLRHVLLTAVLPSYIEDVLMTTCSWILALPMLDASAKTIARLLYDTDLDNDGSVSTAVSSIDAVLLSCQQVVVYALEHLGQLTLPHAQRMLASIFSLCSSTVTIVSFLERTTSKAFKIVRRLQVLDAQARGIAMYLSSPEDFYELDVPHEILGTEAGLWPDTRSFSSKQFQDAMTQDWSATDGRYYVRRGNMFKEVAVTLDEDEAGEELLGAIGEFVRCWSRYESRGTRRVGNDNNGFGLGSLIV